MDFRDFQLLSDRWYSVKKIFYRAFLTRHRSLFCANKPGDCDYDKLIRSLLVNSPTLKTKNGKKWLQQDFPKEVRYLSHLSNKCEI